ncbi:hypothetical protein Fisuc_2372 [Fibrobacter succinogenes subsp. succinogenes S85]|uniref:Uncharacterized protein n=2 Tax=Fibrobacter succinogenes TaxID=833 RepID=A0ABM5LKM5_FIBSS|nr:hypothetical protein Fisuc_2372 [Fibrobacter succinogenes subsp. succinogenes S85]
MIQGMKITVIALCVSTATLMASSNQQKVCPRLLTNASMIINIEGKFVNEERNRTRASIEWRHHSDALDTFFVKPNDSRPFTYITAGKYRYIEFEEGKIKRQLGLHHLRENIGLTPLKLDDLELLANGYFKCPDTTKLEPNKNILATAASNTWWSLVVDSLPNPEKAVMRGAPKSPRYFSLANWKSYAGETFPTLASVSGENYSGSLWISSAYPSQALELAPENKPVKPKILLPVPKLFGKIAVEGERKIPLILKLNQKLLSE